MKFYKVPFGIILTIFHDEKTSADLCVVRQINLVMDTQQHPMVTEFDCPILELLPTCFIVSSHSVISPISLVHLCNHLCHLTEHSLNLILCFV